MNQRIINVRIAALLVLAVLSLTLLPGCNNYARMRDDEAIEAYNDEFPSMPKKAIPVKGGVWVERMGDPNTFVNPMPVKPEVIAAGSLKYKFYCIQCHGPKADGNGTVGQSFSPLPANLSDPRVQNQTDGELFYKIRFGYKRHPALFGTASSEETWEMIRYIRSLVNRS